MFTHVSQDGDDCHTEGPEVAGELRADFILGHPVDASRRAGAKGRPRMPALPFVAKSYLQRECW